MHMDNLEGSNGAPVFTPRRPVEGQMSFGAGQPEYNGPSQDVRGQVAPGLGIPDMLPQAGGHGYMQHPDLNGYGHAQGNILQVRYPDARQKKLGIRPFDGSELYEGLGSGFLEWGRRFERQISLAQSSCEFEWPEDVKVDVIGLHLL
uniref:Uncharacterized protein n=1 Tax=Peronospora matthiolae TaxID=2874970 RepID=A0AAV1VEI6_9STRA